MNNSEIQNRRAIFPERMYSHEEYEAIDRVVKNNKYNNKDLKRICYKILAQNAKSNDLSVTNSGYVKYLKSL